MRSRSWVLRILYVWDSQEGRRPLIEIMEETLRARRVSPAREPIVRRHIDALVEHAEAIDDCLRDAMDNWRLERLSRIDRSILRLAVAELLYLSDVPEKVTLQEAVRLAGQYGGNESPRFVNGVMDAVFQRHRQQG